MDLIDLLNVSVTVIYGCSVLTSGHNVDKLLISHI